MVEDYHVSDFFVWIHAFVMHLVCLFYTPSILNYKVVLNYLGTYSFVMYLHYVSISVHNKKVCHIT